MSLTFEDVFKTGDGRAWAAVERGETGKRAVVGVTGRAGALRMSGLGVKTGIGVIYSKIINADVDVRSAHVQQDGGSGPPNGRGAGDGDDKIKRMGRHASGRTGGGGH